MVLGVGPGEPRSLLFLPCFRMAGQSSQRTGKVAASGALDLAVEVEQERRRELEKRRLPGAVFRIPPAALPGGELSTCQAIVEVALRLKLSGPPLSTLAACL